MPRAATIATALTLAALGTVPAQAELGASGTRLSVAGSTARFYMTYGHLDEREFFAPVVTELKRLQITFEVEAESCVVFHKGEKVATWPVIRSRDDIPKSLDKPFILVLGSTTFVPVKRLSKLLPIDLNWDKRNNLVSVVPGSAKPPVVATRPPTKASPPSVLPKPNIQVIPEFPTNPVEPVLTGAIELSGVEVEQVGKGVRLRFKATGPVQPTSHYLKAPARIVFDFPNAHWAAGLTMSEGKGGVQRLRYGHPKPDQARLVLEVNSPALKVSGIEVVGGEVRLSLGSVTQVAKATPLPPATRLTQQIRDAVTRRGNPAMVQITRSRGGFRVRIPSPSQTAADPLALPSNAWQYIVIHHSATPSGNAAAFDAAHRGKNWDGLAYHFVINNGKGNPDGYLEVSPRWNFQKHGAHAGGLPGGMPAEVRNGFNEFGIGICLVGNFTRSKPSQKQLQTLAVLIRELRAEFTIPAANVLGHGHVKGTACPGASFPWQKLFSMMDLPTPANRHKHTALTTTARCPWCQEHSTDK